MTLDSWVSEFNIEGRPVRCHESDGHRLWRCECAYFQRTLAIYQQGFCPHVVVAIERAMRGTVSPSSMPTTSRDGDDSFRRP
jgi:hypothetical protein